MSEHAPLNRVQIRIGKCALPLRAEPRELWQPVSLRFFLRPYDGGDPICASARVDVPYWSEDALRLEAAARNAAVEVLGYLRVMLGEDALDTLLEVNKFTPLRPETEVRFFDAAGEERMAKSIPIPTTLENFVHAWDLGGRSVNLSRAEMKALRSARDWSPWPPKHDLDTWGAFEMDLIEDWRLYGGPCLTEAIVPPDFRFSHNPRAHTLEVVEDRFELHHPKPHADTSPRRLLRCVLAATDTDAPREILASAPSEKNSAEDLIGAIKRWFGADAFAELSALDSLPST